MRKILGLFIVVLCLSTIGCSNNLKEPVQESNQHETETQIPIVSSIAETPTPSGVQKTETPIKTEEPIETEAIGLPIIDYSYNSQVIESEQVVFTDEFIFLVFQDTLYKFDRNESEKYKIDEGVGRYLSLSDEKLYYIKTDGIYYLNLNNGQVSRIIKEENIYEILVKGEDLYYMVLNNPESDTYDSTLYHYNIKTKKRKVISDYVYEYLALYKEALYFTEGVTSYSNEIAMFSNNVVTRLDIYSDGGYKILEDEIYYADPEDEIAGMNVYNIITKEKRIDYNASFNTFYHFFVIDENEKIEGDLWNSKIYLNDTRNNEEYYLTSIEYSYSLQSSYWIKGFQESLYYIEKNWNEGYNIYEISIGESEVGVKTIVEFKDLM